MVTDKIGNVLLYIVRHASVDEDDEGLIRGLGNASLNDKGKEQAAELERMFADIPVSAVYSDDLDRSYQTAISIAHAKELKVNKDTDLRSWHLGADLEGHSIAANEYMIRDLKLQPHKIPVGGESWGDFEAKTIKAFDRYIAKALKAAAPIVLVLHGSDIQVIWHYIGAKEKSGAYDDTPLDNSGVACISMSRGGYTVKVLRGAKELVDA